MGKGGGSAPAPTPPGDTAKADYGADVASAGFGMQHGTPNQFSPGGSVTFDKYGLPTQELGNGKTVPGGEGIGNVYTAFNPTLQGVWDTLQSKGNDLASQLPTGFNPNISTDALRKSYIDEGLGNVQKVWAEENDAFKGLMGERGIPIGSEIWNDQMGKIQDSRNSYLQGLTSQAHQAAGADESRQFQLALAKNQADQGMFSNFATWLQAMQAGLQGRDSPIVTAQAPNVDVAGITRAYDQANYNRWAANQQSGAGIGSVLGGIGSILGALPFSDERLKEGSEPGSPPEPVGETYDGETIYRYHMPGQVGMRMGLLAGAVQKKHPEAVHKFPGTDIRMVDYEKATEDAVKESA